MAVSRRRLVESAIVQVQFANVRQVYCAVDADCFCCLFLLRRFRLRTQNRLRVLSGIVLGLRDTMTYDNSAKERRITLSTKFIQTMA